MKKTAVLLMIIAVLSKVSGFLRDITLSFFYGATSTSDAYIISITITSVLFSLIISGISTAYIPMFKQIEHDKGHRSASLFTNNLINIVLIVTTGIILLGLLFSNLLVKLFALGFDGETLKTAVLFTRIGLVGIYFTSLTQLFISYLQLNGKFTIPALIGFPFNIIIIISIFISSQTNIIILAIGSVLAAFFQMLFLFPTLWKTNYRYIPIVQFTDKNIKKMAIIVFPIMIGISIDQINLMVDKTLASTLVEGGISALTYASRLNDFVQGIFVLSFVTVMFPLISNMAAKKNDEDFKTSISDVISSVILIVVPASVGIMILADPIIRLLFGHGHFDERAIDMTSHALFFYSIGMIGYGFREILNRTFYSLQDTKTPMYNASISVVLNIVLNFVLSSYMGISGLALATSISALFCSTLLVISLRKKIGAFGLKGNFITFVKVTFASTVMGSIVYVLYVYIIPEWNALLKMTVVICAGSVVYFILVNFLKVKETKLILSYFKKKIHL
ncbi:murein biosynthesis integral membrane protein MurJ [Psychrobacillus sp. NPDC096389]|uniref:murein biosynthesis integral membrane protein MurJ n=1 Tax=Psychrobacillus sp. NPDC096389 TaxID=3364490 RepID=UPI00380E67C2